ncbi:MAG: hypothetical protein FE834_03920 [Gammaproteobacteria bacterium]|nr:hypothetical protein [Gammaproteobacteria bacterium]
MMKNKQQELFENKKRYKYKDVLKNIKSLIKMHSSGLLGGEEMPEDSMPGSIKIGSFENFHFLTLPMALNYQRNSYTLWKAAAKAFEDEECSDIFYPDKVIHMSVNELRKKLIKHKVALQPNKHIDIWFRICETVCKYYKGDIRNVISSNNYDVSAIRKDVQCAYKKGFPYLSGEKIFNYWLYVLDEYTNIELVNKNEITVAPDTHIIQATVHLGLLDKSIEELMKNRVEVADIWKEYLSKTDINPIDIHTPLWLWSKADFPVISH